jgi:hypothetical protein
MSTMTTMTSVSGTMTATMNPSEGTVDTDSGGSTDAGDTGLTSGGSNPTSDDATTTPVEGAPVFLSLQSNVSKITSGESVTFTAVLTDPDGVDDIVGGTLSDETGKIGYGPFVAAGQPGTYSITVSWDAMQQADPIEFENADLMRVFRAEFYDQAAHKVRKDTNLALTCATGSACDGVCTDLMNDLNHCGACGGVCKDGCSAGQCMPTWGECLSMISGIETCDMYCASVGEACVENGCGGFDATIRIFDVKMNCEQALSPNISKEPCNTIQTWAEDRPVIQCCCSDTK